VSVEPHRDRALADLRQRLRRLDLSDYDAWMHYLECGGQGVYLEFEAYLYGALVMVGADWAALEHSVWEAENF
jgi:hypothetical protein